MRIPVRWVVSAGLVAVAASSAAQSPFAEDRIEAIHYYNGDSRVERVLALDELAVISRAGTALRADRFAAAGRSAEVVNGEARRLILRYDAPVTDAAGLNARAVALIGPDSDAEAVAYPPGAEDRSAAYREYITDRLTVQLRNPARLDSVLNEYDLRLVERIGEACVLAANGGELLAAIDAANRLYESGEVVFATPLLARQQQPRFIPNDTFFPLQWHLRNTGQASGGIAGNDVNVLPAWDSYTGAGVNIAITDTGVEVVQPDLVAHVRADIDLDINGNDLNPTPSASAHGTAVAGIAAAVGNNNLGVAGAAFNAGIVGIRLIEAETDDSDEATAMGHQVDPRDEFNAPIPEDRVHVNNNSWGPADCGCVHETFGPLMGAALVDGVTHGRGGLGTIYVWAAGNGRESRDNVNYDGYASSRYTIAVGATGGNGVVSYYSEPGASMLVNTPSSYGNVGTTTTTRSGFGNLAGDYTTAFGGTSSASPLAAGCVALMLEANPGLGWRDVQHILVDTAFKNHPTDPSWFTNGGGREFNHNYGFGRIDAAAAASRAEGWTNVETETVLTSDVQTVNAAVPDSNPAGVSRTIVMSGVPAGFFVEHVEVVLNATHTGSTGEFEIELASPSGTTSVLAAEHGDGPNYSNWKFTSLAHWGENPTGLWSLRMSDEVVLFSGTFQNWQLIVYGITIDTDDVSLDPTHTGFVNGHPNWPYTDFFSAMENVDEGGTIRIESHVALPAPKGFSKPVTLIAANGPVLITVP